MVMALKIHLLLHATKRIIKFRMKRWRPRLLENSAIMKYELLGRKLQAILMLLLFKLTNECPIATACSKGTDKVK